MLGCRLLFCLRSIRIPTWQLRALSLLTGMNLTKHTIRYYMTQSLALMTTWTLPHPCMYVCMFVIYLFMYVYLWCPSVCLYFILTCSDVSFPSRVQAVTLPFNSYDRLAQPPVNRVSHLGIYQIVNGLPRYHMISWLLFCPIQTVIFC